MIGYWARSDACRQTRLPFLVDVTLCVCNSVCAEMVRHRFTTAWGRMKRKAQTDAKRAVGYVRVSTADQATEGSSLDAQEARVQAYCVAGGLELVALIREEGVSASVPLSRRPAGGLLLQQMAELSAGHVVALKLDRLFRDTADALTQSRHWDEAGVALHLVDMGGQALNTASAVGRVFLTMLAAFGEFERNLVGERVKLALSHKRQTGKAVSRAPRGARLSREADGRNAVLVVDADGEGLRMYLRARSLRRLGLSYAAVADCLTVEGFRPRRASAKRAGIAGQTVRYMLANRNLQKLATPIA